MQTVVYVSQLKGFKMFDVPAPPSVRRADPLTLPAGLDDAGDERLEQDLVVLLFFVLPPSPCPRADDDSVPPVLAAGLPADDKLLELPDSLPFSAGKQRPPDCNIIVIILRFADKSVNFRRI